MTAALVAVGMWPVVGVVVGVALRTFRRRAWAPAVPALMGVVIAVCALQAPAWGDPYGASGAIQMARVPGAVLAAGCIALAIIRWLSPRDERGDVIGVVAVGTAATALTVASDPLQWGLALLVAALGMGLRWVIAAPGTHTLAAGRIGGLAGCCGLAASLFHPVAEGATGAWPALLAWLLAAAVMGILAVPPVGGWIVAAARSLRAGDVGLWLCLVVPATLLSATRIAPQLETDARGLFRVLLIGAGLSGALWSAVMAALGTRAERYLRVVAADIGLATMVAASPSADAGLAIVLLLTTHLLMAPLLLAASGRVPPPAVRIAWFAAAGVPGGPAFWGRLLALQVAAAAAGLALVPAFVVVAVTGVAALGVATAPSPPGPFVPRRHAIVPAVLLLLGLGVGIAPLSLIHAVAASL